MKMLSMTLLFIFLPDAAWTQNFCDPLTANKSRFARSVKPLDQTESFIGYLSSLLQNGILTPVHLEILLKGLKKNEIKNPITLREGQIDGAMNNHREGIEIFLKKSEQIDLYKLDHWIRSRLGKEKKEKKEKQRAKSKTTHIFKRAWFIKIKPGKFTMGNDVKKSNHLGEKFEAEVTEPFMVADTEVTQFQFASIMGFNPSEFSTGPNGLLVKIKGKAIQMQPDNPVEQVLYREAWEFIHRLNELSKKNDPLIYQVLHEHIPGTVYRLPTEVEWEYVARNLGTAKEDYFYGNDPALLSEYAWFGKLPKRSLF